MNDPNKSSNNNFHTSTPISTKVNSRTKNDSAYSSFVSTKAQTIMTSNTSLIRESNSNYESPGTSFSSRNSALVNEEEMDEFFRIPETFNSLDNDPEKIPNPSFFLPDSSFRRSARNSPWTGRPESAPLNEEEEDSDKEASNYSCSFQENLLNITGLTETDQSTLSQQIRIRHASMTDTDSRNEIIAFQLRQIADNLPNKQKKIRHKSCVIQTERLSGSRTKRHSHSSFSDLIPNEVELAIGVISSFYEMYKRHSAESNGSNIGNSQSMHLLNTRQRSNNRYRSYTE